jgi:hypothetical protein
MNSPEMQLMKGAMSLGASSLANGNPLMKDAMSLGASSLANGNPLMGAMANMASNSGLLPPEASAGLQAAKGFGNLIGSDGANALANFAKQNGASALGPGLAALAGPLGKPGMGGVAAQLAQDFMSGKKISASDVGLSITGDPVDKLFALLNLDSIPEARMAKKTLRNLMKFTQVPDNFVPPEDYLGAYILETSTCKSVEKYLKKELHRQIIEHYNPKRFQLEQRLRKQIQQYIKDNVPDHYDGLTPPEKLKKQLEELKQTEAAKQETATKNKELIDNIEQQLQKHPKFDFPPQSNVRFLFPSPPPQPEQTPEPESVQNTPPTQ